MIESSEDTLKILNQNSDIKNFQKFLSRSRAILIFPEVYEGGFIFGAKGGNGVLLIKKGEKFTEKNLTFKRPGGGMSPMNLWKILGTKSKKDYEKEDIIQ